MSEILGMLPSLVFKCTLGFFVARYVVHVTSLLVMELTISLLRIRKSSRNSSTSKES